MEKRTRCKRGTRWNKITVKCEPKKIAQPIADVSDPVVPVKQKRCSRGYRRNKLTNECDKTKKSPLHPVIQQPVHPVSTVLQPLHPVIQPVHTVIQPVRPATPGKQTFDIIIGAFLHGATTTVCPTKYQQNFANATLMEASPCGSSNYIVSTDCDFIKKMIKKYHYEGVDNTALTHTLQAALRKEKVDTISLVTKRKPTFYDSPNSVDYKAQEGWRIMNHGYLERRYTPDPDPKSFLKKVLVYYESSKSGRFKTDENLYLKYKVKNRTELMQLLKNAGYKNPLIIDYSCGGWCSSLKYDSPTGKKMKKIAEDLGVAGGSLQYKID